MGEDEEIRYSQTFCKMKEVYFDKLTLSVLAIFVGSALGITAYRLYLRKRYALPILLQA